jgi:tetraacyldisaccharide 4'-kinase
MNPWSNGWVLPAGRLREPFSSLRRADCIVATRAQLIEEVLREKIRKHSDAPIFFSQTVIRRIAPLDSSENLGGKAGLSKRPIAAFCGIGNPAAFVRQLRDENLEVAVFETFRDHHRYAQSEIDRVTQRALAAGATALVTTAKDAVKLRSLRSSLPLFVAEIEIEISEPDKLLALIETAIEAKRAAH